MRFLYTMPLFTSLERIGNRLDDLFVFKDPEKEVKEDSMMPLYTMSTWASLKETEMDSDL